MRLHKSGLTCNLNLASQPKGPYYSPMNRLSTERRAQILGMMVDEGNSIRAIVRMTGASKNTIVDYPGNSTAAN